MQGNSDSDTELKKTLTTWTFSVLKLWNGQWPCGTCAGCRALALARCMSIAHPGIDDAEPAQRLIVSTLKEIVHELPGDNELRALYRTRLN